MVLDPGRNVDEQREARRVRLGKAVFAEAEDLPVDAFGELALVAALEHAADQALLERLETAFFLPRSHRAAQRIGLSRRESCGDDRKLHHLLLEDRHAERALEHALHFLARIDDRIDSLPPPQVRMHHAALDRPRAHDRHFDHQVVVIRRFQPRQHRHLRARLDLEHADGVGVLDHLVDRRILDRDVLHPHAAEVERAADRREHAERKHVDLQQAERLEVVLVPLDHGARGHRGVLHRHQLGHGSARDHEAADVLRKMAREADQLAGERKQLPHRQALRIQAGFAHALVQRGFLVPPRKQLRQAIDLWNRKPERLAEVAHRAAWPVADHRCRERRTLASIFPVHILDHFLAPLVLEIDVDVGRLVALLRDEALEQHRHPSRVHLGDPERIADCRVRGRSPALAQDLARAREAHDVVHGEEERLVAQLGDQFQLVLDQLAHAERRAGGKPAA